MDYTIQINLKLSYKWIHTTQLQVLY